MLPRHLEPYAEHGRSGGVQAHAGPGEGHQGRARLDRVQQQCVQGGVEQRGMQRVAAGLLSQRLGQRHLGEQFVVTTPHPAQPPEGGPVAVSDVGERVVEVGDRDLGGADRRPHGQSGAGVGGRGCQRAFGVRRPRTVDGRVVLGPAVQREPAPACVVRLADGELDLHRTGRRRQHQRGGQGQFGDRRCPDVPTGVCRQLRHRGCRDQDVPATRVLGQPRMRVRGEASGEHVHVPVGHAHGGAQQRVARAGHAEPARVDARCPGPAASSARAGTRRWAAPPGVRRGRRRASRS